MPPRDTEDRMPWHALPRQTCLLPRRIRAHPPAFETARADVSDARANVAEIVQYDDSNKLLCADAAGVTFPPLDETGAKIRR